MHLADAYGLPVCGHRSDVVKTDKKQDVTCKKCLERIDRKHCSPSTNAT